jgi:anti-sigma-K factor RskA
VAAVTAVAAAVIVGLVGLGWAVSRQSPTAPEAPVSAVASLRHLDAPTFATGVVVVRSIGSTRQMHIRIDGLGHPPPNHFYEVWLLRPATNKMLPVGILPPSGAANFELSASLMSQYSAIDVSLQVNDGDATHSSQSVLRGPIQTVTT